MSEIWKTNKKIFKKNLRKSLVNFKELKRDIKIQLLLNQHLWKNMKGFKNSLQGFNKFMLINIEIQSIQRTNFNCSIKFKNKS